MTLLGCIDVEVSGGIETIVLQSADSTVQVTIVGTADQGNFVEGNSYELRLNPPMRPPDVVTQADMVARGFANPQPVAVLAQGQSPPSIVTASPATAGRVAGRP